MTHKTEATGCCLLGWAYDDFEGAWVPCPQHNEHDGRANPAPASYSDFDGAYVADLEESVPRHWRRHTGNLVLDDFEGAFFDLDDL